jgi:hypothetical protein
MQQNAVSLRRISGRGERVNLEHGGEESKNERLG